MIVDEVWEFKVTKDVRLSCKEKVFGVELSVNCVCCFNMSNEGLWLDGTHRESLKSFAVCG